MRDDEGILAGRRKTRRVQVEGCLLEFRDRPPVEFGRRRGEEEELLLVVRQNRLGERGRLRMIQRLLERVSDGERKRLLAELTALRAR